MNKYAFLLSIRKGSERVPNKNTRAFAGIGGGILELKTQQLLSVKRVGDIIISTNDEVTKNIACSFLNDRIKIIERPNELCLSSTVIEDFIDYIPTVVDAEHIFGVHATTPFANVEVLNSALDCYEVEVLPDNTFDSLLSVSKIQQFLWSRKVNKCINYDRSVVKWPRTQDLDPLFEINHAFYINSRENYLKFHDRIGEFPLLLELDRIHAIDINWEEDFIIAEMSYKKLNIINKLGGVECDTLTATSLVINRDAA